MMERKVNGKAFKDVLALLREKKEPPHSLDNGIKYFSADEYFEIFDSIVGPANYTVEYSDFNYMPTQVGTGQELFSVKCRITILDDDGKPILFKEGYGGYVSRYNKETKKDVNLQNAPDFVCSYAFKTAAKKFGTFGPGKTKENNPSGNKPKTKANKKESSNNERKRAVIKFITDGGFFVQNESKDGKVWKINAYEVVGEKMRSTVSQVIFYPDKYRKDADKFNYYLAECSDKARKPLRINTTLVGEPVDGMKQYVFLGFEAA